MPRKQFMADLQKAQQDVLPLNIHSLKQGEDDGQFEFLFTTSNMDGDVKVTALIPDLGEYPKSHEYMIFSGEEAPPAVARALQDVRRTDGKTVFELLDIVSSTLSRLSPDHDGDTHMAETHSEADDEEVDEDYDDDVYDSDHEAFQTDDVPTTPYARPSPGMKTRIDRTFRTRAKADLLQTKNAGFRVGVLGGLLEGFNAFVTVSIRMSKLGISEEAMQAWQVEASDYLILILQYPNGYKTNEELQGFDSIRLDSNIGMRVCVGKKHKPSLQEAIKAFTIATKGARDVGVGNELPNAEDSAGESSIKDAFISKPLNQLLKERLVRILVLRSGGMSWSGAEQLYNDQATAGATPTNTAADKYYYPEQANPTLPDIVNADHYNANTSTPHSFPLLAMQFLLRHFVRSTEFCLVCYRKLDSDVEAIKPYVCDSELCLYQYMSLGFGPSIEHEIVAQPYVVDLLVSFCYSSATMNKLKEFPIGLSLVVPPMESNSAYDAYLSSSAGSWGGAPKYGRAEAAAEPKITRVTPPTFEIGFDRDRLEIIFFKKPDQCPVKRGDWIVVQASGTLGDAELHCRVSETTFYPTISVNEPIVLRRPSKIPDGTSTLPDKSANTSTDAAVAKAKPATPATTPKWQTATFQVYCQDFKENLTNTEKCLAICKLLDTLPDVKSLQEYVLKHPSGDLRTWIERISPAALSLLRWIIASNRACIMQVEGDCEKASGAWKQESVYGMKDCMQFRFAMGAPDKEQRFVNEVRKTTDRLKLQYPTIFAWHGSPLFNWHMIIREGLHYKNIDHGRAYGDGVYHALDANTSTGYSGMNYSYSPGSVSPGMWPNSVLRISSALALNEIINAPAEFQSSKPYYVVKQLDWIQTRYLFVQCAPNSDSVKISGDKKPVNALPQDPSRIPRGNHDAMVIPASAIKSSRLSKNDRRPATPQDRSPVKKLKANGGFNDPIPIDDDSDAVSVATDVSDVEILFPDEPEPEPESLPIIQLSKAKTNAPTTDFVPGSLDFSKLPLMPTPTYATSGTTKRLMKDLQTVRKLQDGTAVAELGWYIDTDKIENVYQWIIELHSFDNFEIKGKKLPLAEDMKKMGVKSIVLEIRFNKDFPYTPPYVRVIRPRFLGFNQGGGGHIVLGGAMCMELLTNTGWTSVSSMESVLMQIRMAIASEPFARLDMRSHGDYGTGEAAEGYLRACQTHGWQVPPGFREMAYGGGSSA